MARRNSAALEAPVVSLYSVTQKMLEDFVENKATEERSKKAKEKLRDHIIAQIAAGGNRAVEPGDRVASVTNPMYPPTIDWPAELEKRLGDLGKMTCEAIKADNAREENKTPRPTLKVT